MIGERGGRRAVALACALVLLSAERVTAQLPAGEGARVVRAGLVGFGTGDDVNCPSGTGVVGGVELRTRGRWFAGLGADLFVATPAACADVLTIVLHESGTVYEYSGITLLFAPRLSGRVGTALDVEGVRVEPSFAAGAVYAAELWGPSERTVLPWLGGAIAVQPRAWGFGIVLEHGYNRVPVRHQRRGVVDAQVIDEFGRWKRVTNLTVMLRR